MPAILLPNPPAIPTGRIEESAAAANAMARAAGSPGADSALIGA